MAGVDPFQAREYNPADRDAVIALAPRLTDGMPTWREPAAWLSAVRGWVRDSAVNAGQPGHAMYVAVAGEQVVGLVSVSERTHFTGQVDAYVGELITAAGMERRGIARALMAAGRPGALAHGLRCLTLETGAANQSDRSFYAALGYCEEDVRLTKDSGRNDGFVKSGSGPVAMGYWEQADQPFYHSLARVFPIADRYFSSLLGQTYPNRRYLISATSLGMINDTTPGASDYPPNGTIFDKLDAVGTSWKDYISTLPTTELYPELYFKNAGTRVVPIADFFADAAAGTLPGYCLVEPHYGTQSEEDPQNIAVGEQFAAKVINAVMAGPAWPSTMLIWTYDEHGGYYDHVPPPPALAPDDIPPEVTGGESAYNGFAQYGFRVPCAVISPWARPRHVSHEIMDHTSICALVEAKWNLPAMTYRDANASNMLHMIDRHRPAFLDPPVLAKPLADIDPGALACSVSGPGTIPPPGSVTPG